MPISNEQQLYLGTVLSFAQKILLEDQTVSDDITTLNNMTLTDDDKASINDTLQGELDNPSLAKIDFLTNVVSGLNFIDSNYFNALINISQIDLNNTAALKAEVSSQLAAVYNFSSDLHVFNFYKRLSMLAIATKDSATIQAAIEKVQSLGVV